jgi:hypothetical protein
MEPRLRMGIADAERLPFSQRRQCQAMLDAWAWHDEQAELDRIADEAIRRATRGR